MVRLSATLKFSRDVHESPKAGVAAIGHCRTALLAIVERAHRCMACANAQIALPATHTHGKPALRARQQIDVNVNAPARGAPTIVQRRHGGRCEPRPRKPDRPPLAFASSASEGFMAAQQASYPPVHVQLKNHGISPGIVKPAGGAPKRRNTAWSGL